MIFFNKKTFFLTVLTVHSALACTTIIVGRQASIDGSIIIARNSDSYTVTRAKHFVLHPHHSGSTIFYSTKNNFSYDLGNIQLAYSGLPYAETNDKSFEQVGTNELGVSISATETIQNNPDALAIDPMDKINGINEDSIVSVIMPLAKNAKDGIKLLGKIIETKGIAEGFGVAIADKNEVWYLETATGHRWVAVRIPHDSYFVATNQARIQELNLQDSENYLGSPDLVEFAVNNKLYNSNENPFNFRMAYGKFADKDYTHNYPRIAELIRLYSGLNLDYQLPKGEYPLFLKPSKKLSVLDVEAGLSDHFQHFNSVASHDAYNLQNPKETWRPISVFRATNSHVTQIMADKPAGIANVEYIALGMQSLSFFIPFYNGITTVPYAYTLGDAKADSSSAYWKFRKLQTLVMLNYPKYAPEVHKQIMNFNKWLEQQQTEVEKIYELTLNPEVLNQFTNSVVDKAINIAESLSANIIEQEKIDYSDEWLTKTAIEIDEAYHFSGL